MTNKLVEAAMSMSKLGNVTFGDPEARKQRKLERKEEREARRVDKQTERESRRYDRACRRPYCSGRYKRRYM